MADYPSTDYKSFKIGSNQEVEQFQSESGKMQARLIGGQKFEINITHPPMLKTEYFPIDAFIMGLNGSDTTCTVSLAGDVGALGAVSGSPVVNGARVAGSTSIAIDGLVAGTADVFVAGDFINYASHGKAYKVVSTVAAGADENILDEVSGDILDEVSGSIIAESSGQANVTIFPPLVDDVATNTAVSYGTSFRFTVKTTDMQSYKVQPPNIYQKTVKFIEYIS